MPTRFGGTEKNMNVHGYELTSEWKNSQCGQTAKATKGGKQFLKLEKPLIVYNNDGTYTKEILNIYNKKGEKDDT